MIDMNKQGERVGKPRRREGSFRPLLEMNETLDDF
jgi:hypothetical protein